MAEENAETRQNNKNSRIEGKVIFNYSGFYYIINNRG